MQRPLIAILLCLVMPGCVVVKVGVTNPVEGLSTVAVAPFFNLSQERAVDGRRFALAYYSELQKVPGFQVVPVGVTEQKIRDHDLNMDDPQDVLQLAELLGVDAVVVGAVTDYDPYYPPRIGLHVEWYSPRCRGFSPGIPVDPEARTRWREAHRHRRQLSEGHGHDEDWQEDCPPEEAADRTSFRGQSPEAVQVSSEATHNLPVRRHHAATGPLKHADYFAATAQPTPRQQVTAPPSTTGYKPASTDREAGNAASPTASPEFDCYKPFMSYTRLFDGADAELTASLRDYVELSGDRRGGGWDAYLQRSEDFIRFTAHLMIVEMLTLHGGDARRQIVFKLRKYK